MRPIKGLLDCMAPAYMAIIAIRTRLPGSPLVRPLASGFGMDLAIEKHMRLWGHLPL